MPFSFAMHNVSDDDMQHGAAVRIIVLVFFAFFLSVVVRTAWVADDAYVDLRTAVNAASGLGLRWNADERVQTFTDPAWVALLSVTSVFAHRPYFVALILNLVLSAGAVALVATQLAVDSAAAVVALSVLTFSKAFIEYATSGLQVALVYLLVVTFAVTYWRMSDGRLRIAIMFAIFALCLLTDAMSALLLVPALAMTLLQSRGRSPFALVPGLTLLSGWALFATLYFGSLVPTPVVAAWHAQWPLGMRLTQGGAYLLDAADVDPLTVVAIGCGIAALFVRRCAPARPLAWGLLLYCTAVIVSGGDSLSGRALAPAVLATATLAVRQHWNSVGTALPATVALIWGIGLMSPFSPVRSNVHYGLNRSDALPPPWPHVTATVSPPRAAIRDERWLTYTGAGLLPARRDVSLPDTRAMEREVEEILARNQHVVVTDRIGLFAFVSGTRLHVVDPLGRTDPLLARLTPATCCTPRASARAIPDGYVETLETGRNVIGDSDVAATYQRVATLSKGACFDRRRLTALIR